MVRLFLLLPSFYFLFLLPESTSAQYKRQREKFAAELMRKGDYHNAAIHYRDLLKLDSTRAAPNYNYAEALRHTFYYEKALHYYNVAYRKDRGKEFPDAVYWMAQMYKSTGDYSKAKRYFKRAERYYRGRRSTYFYAKVKQEQAACDEATRMMKKPGSVMLNNLGDQVNTVHSEFAGYLFNDSTLFFSSLRAEYDSTIADLSYTIKLYAATRADSIWQQEVNSPIQSLNSNDYHTANGVFNYRKNKFFFTICSDSGTCEIYSSAYYKGEWSRPVALCKKVNLPGYTTTHPALTRMDGDDILFFVSDRPGGEGRKDIWYTTIYSNGVCGDPKNAGPQVNSVGDEIAPFYHKDGATLFFSSDWHKGLGGHDIFRADGIPGQFGPPENLGFPINSPVNDMYFKMAETQAIITSNRAGSFTEKSATCCNDLYIFDYEVKKKEQKDSLQLSYDALIEYLPLQLFFHNDEPNPRTNANTTQLNYLTTYRRYVLMLDRYKKEYSKGLKGDDKLDAQEDIADFFDERVKEGATNLQLFSKLLLKELAAGKEIELTVKGYASPLSKSDYNANLTLRRISSIQNYFNEYSKGAFLPYFQSGKLKIKQEPYGEDQAASSVSDNVNDKRNSIYSKQAAFERRVEIISLTLNK